MYELKKIGKVLTSKSVGTGPSSYEKRIYRAAVSQRLRNTGLVALLSALSRLHDSAVGNSECYESQYVAVKLSVCLNKAPCLGDT